MKTVDDFKQEVGNILREVIKHVGKNQKEFAEQIGVKDTALSAVLRGKSGISSDLAHSIIISYPQLNWNWLFMEKGEMIIGSNVVVGHSNQIGSMVVAEKESEYSTLREEVAALRERVKGLETQILLKDEIINLLKNK